jgi:hypothetical protein
MNTIEYNTIQYNNNYNTKERRLFSDCSKVSLIVVLLHEGIVIYSMKRPYSRVLYLDFCSIPS